MNRDKSENTKSQSGPEVPSSESFSKQTGEEITARNRQNAQRSTGPRTEAGKNRSRWNSTKHGLLAKTLIAGVAARNPNDPAVHSFRALHNQLHGELQPVGALEELQLERAAAAYWRMHLTAKFEAEMLVKVDVFYSQGIDRLTRYQAASRNEFNQALLSLERLQRIRQGEKLSAPLQVDVNMTSEPIDLHAVEDREHEDENNPQTRAVTEFLRPDDQSNNRFLLPPPVPRAFSAGSESRGYETNPGDEEIKTNPNSEPGFTEPVNGESPD